MIKRIPGWFLALFLLPGICSANILDANWRSFFSLSGGVANTKVGSNAYFPIQNPATDEFYSYQTQPSTKKTFYFDGMWGMQALLFPNYYFQLGLDYAQIGAFTSEGMLTQGANARSANTYSYQYRFIARQVLLEGKFLITLANVFHPYIMAGAGIGINKAYDYSVNTGNNFTTFTRQYADNTTTSFSYAFGAGVDFDVTAAVRFGLGYRYSNFGTVSLGNAVINTTPVAGTLKQNNLSSNIFLAQLTWII